MNTSLIELGYDREQIIIVDVYSKDENNKNI